MNSISSSKSDLKISIVKQDQIKFDQNGKLVDLQGNKEKREASIKQMFKKMNPQANIVQEEIPKEESKIK